MATKPDGEADGYIFQWKIENISHSWWLKKAQCIYSLAFMTEALQDTKWCLSLYPMGCVEEKTVGVLLNREKDCTGPKIVEVYVQFAFLGKDGMNLKKNIVQKASFKPGDSRGHVKYHDRETVFFNEKEAFLPEDTLTVQCKISNLEKAPVKPKHLYTRTTLRTNRRYLVWRIDNASTLQSGLRKEFKDNLIAFDLVLNESFDRLDIEMISSYNVKYFSYNALIIDSEGKKENYGMKKYSASDLHKDVLTSSFSSRMLMENKTRFLPNDVLSLDFEFTFATVEHSYYSNNSYFSNNPYVAKKERYRSTQFLTDDLNSMYNDAIFSDMEIRTSTKTFPVHKNILSARSSVFRNMFSHDMMEKNSGHVLITDFEDDTIHRMLLYMYTEFLEDLQLESASKLYSIADKYQILPLKSKCSSFLIRNLFPTNACDVLLLADHYHDDELANAVHEYILGQSKSFFFSQEWIDFMESNKDLAIKLLYKKACEE